MFSDIPAGVNECAYRGLHLHARWRCREIQIVDTVSALKKEKRNAHGLGIVKELYNGYYWQFGEIIQGIWRALFKSY